MTQLEHFRAQKNAFFRAHPQSPLTAEQQRVEVDMIASNIQWVTWLLLPKHRAYMAICCGHKKDARRIVPASKDLVQRNGHPLPLLRDFTA